MSHTQQAFQSGQSHAEGESKTGHAIQSVKDAAGSTTDSARQQQEHAAGILQQTGEQVKQMAQGAANAVKSAVGLGDSHSGGGSTTGHH